MSAEGRDGDLTGRTKELDELSGCLLRLGDRLPGVHVAEVVGEAGIGKSALLDRFAAIAQDAGAVVLAGRATREAGDGPFPTFVDVLRDYDTGQHSEFGVFPTDSVSDGLQTVRALLEQFAATTTVLIFDDAHDADPASLDLLAKLLRRPPRSAVLLVLGYRDRKAPVALRSAISNCARQVAVTRIRLAPLSQQDVDDMLGRQGTAGWRHKLYLDSAGNPAYLKALLAEHTSGHTPGTGTGEGARFLAELDGVTTFVRDVAEAASVVGDEFDAKLVAQMLDRPEPEVLRAIGELMTRDLVHPVLRGPCFVFRHPVVRRAVYSGSELSQRIRMHERTDGVLRSRGASPTERAPHVQQSADHGDLGAVEVLDQAASTVVTTEPDTAAAWLTTALRVLPHNPGLHERRAGLLMRLARTRGMAGHLRECRDLMHEALRILPSDARTEHARAVAFTAMVQRLLGAHAETDAMLRAEITAVGPEMLAGAALKFELAAGQLKTGDSASCCYWAEQALETSRRHDDRPLQASCLAILAKAAVGDGHATTAAEHLDQACAIVDGMLDDEFADCLEPVEWIGWSEIMLGRWDDALRHFDKAVAFATRADLRLPLPRLLLGQVFALRSRGQLAEAQAAAEYAVDLAERSNSPEQLFIAHAMRAWVDAIRGCAERIMPTGMIAAGQSREASSSWRDTLALRMLAEARLSTGDPEGCLALLAAVGGTDLPACSSYTRVAWYELFTRAELAAGRTDAAAKWTELATASAALLDQPGRTGLAQLAQAQLLLARSPESALPVAYDAVSRLEAAGMTVEMLRARVVLGGALAHQDRQEDAVRELKVAEMAFERLGAAQLARYSRSERRRLAARGSRPGRGEAGKPADILTTREQQVAELVGEGLTNRLIAKTLHISEKTVEMHLSNVFAKLGVASRAAVAAYVSRDRQVT